MSKQYQWFPGHMAKALKEIKEQISSVDIILELVDARAPFSCLNPVINDLIKNKKTLLIMTKVDLADSKKVSINQEHFRNIGIEVFLMNKNNFNYQKLKELCLFLLKEKLEKDKAKGLRKRPIRAMVLGIPNVGKSTLINTIAKRKATQVKNMPGVTKAQQYIKVDDEFILLDTPGVLWPNFEDKQVGINLSMIGAIKQEILPIEDLANNILSFLEKEYFDALISHYSLDKDEYCKLDSYESKIELIAKSRNFKIDNVSYDSNRTIKHLINEFQNGKIINFCLEVKNG